MAATAKTEDKSENTDTVVVPDPTPYRARHRSETEVKDETAPLSTEPDPDKGEPDPVKDAKPEETITAKPDDTWKKRYDSLKSHHDKSINETRSELSKLREQLSQTTNTPLKLPKTPEEIQKWRSEFPDVYDLVVSISRLQADERAKQIETKVVEIERREKSVSRDMALLELKKLHPDFDEIVSDQGFHDWVQLQPQEVQNWLYGNTDNSKLAARAIDLYKADTNKVKAKTTIVKETEKSKKDAALEVVTSKVVDPDTKGKKIWKLSEITKLKPQEFEKQEKEIDLARREGRIVDG